MGTPTRKTVNQRVTLAPGRRRDSNRSATARAVVLGLTLAAGCGSGQPVKVPLDVKDRFPAASELAISLPGQRGAAGSASEAVFQAVDQAAAAIRSLSVLQPFLALGGESHSLSMAIALEGAPRVADQAVRYLRLPDRLDVDRSGDHAFFYLQHDQGFGFDPDSAIGESRMLIEGSTLMPARPGTRANAAVAGGLSVPGLGYLRFHFNHRFEDENAVHAAAQLDFNTGTGSLALAYFPLPAARGEVPLGFWQQHGRDGGGLVYASKRISTGKPAYHFLAQYRGDGGLAVWTGAGKLWACYDGTGVELGNEKNPAPCGSFKEKLATPPANPDLWPAVPGGIP